MTLDVASECIQKRVVRYDKTGDNHYDTVSALIKSMRGSDPDAGGLLPAKMLYAGEDIKFIARRIMICASEDVGNADPQALVVAVAAAQAVERLGMPEAQITLSQAVTYVASAPKSNAACMAVFQAADSVKNVRTQCRPTSRIPIIKGLQNWDTAWDINTPMTIRITMWNSSTCQQRYWAAGFMSLQKTVTKRTLRIIWTGYGRANEGSMKGQ